MPEHTHQDSLDAQSSKAQKRPATDHPQPSTSDTTDKARLGKRVKINFTNYDPIRDPRGPKHLLTAAYQNDFPTSRASFTITAAQAPRTGDEHLHGLADLIARLEDENSKLKDEIDSTKAAMKDQPTLKKTNPAPPGECDNCKELQRELTKRTAQRDSFQIKLQRAAAELGPIELNRAIGEDDIVSSFINLDHAINNLVRLKFSGLPLRVPKKAADKEFCGEMNGRYKDYLISAEVKSCFMTGAIWQKLYRKLSQRPCAVFMPVMAEALGILMDELPSAKDHQDDTVLQGFHQLRAQTGQLLDRTTRDNGPYKPGSPGRTEFVDELYNFFKNYSSIQGEKELKDDFGRIVDDVVGLGELTAQAKAYYALRMAHSETGEMYGSRLEGWMEVDTKLVADGTAAPTVDLIISPALVKWGTPDGKNYGEAKVLKKAKVAM
ncbi:Uu.00g054140.m01.CDS01 [Anthostomella pinea]|uniref:Uu.00g054140.m01.CDS01 n=1 Tax=Anthostomella pinea TaxID=933095 RepID=A0AAI8VWK0_9PEZI|nr:Uu.00g054140.m01.CDS01 [Anthostomella pinea]